MAKHNPWRGLASYRDPFKYESKGEEYRYKFCGRDSETRDIVKLIDNNLFVTLYGRTGVGKTSLLNAGVFPILRQKGYFPVYLRLAQESTGKSYAEAVINKIENCGLTVPQRAKGDAIDYSSTLSLWEYFCTTSFSYQNQQDIYPIIVLDQFEEIFYGDREKAKLLLLQISKLLSDDLITPEGYSVDTNYRFVLSIREDNLFLLEDCIDELSLDELKDNRFRLRPMSEKNARFVILEPGEEYIDKNEREAIVNRIVCISKDNDGSISSLILSLVCSLLYERAKAVNEEKPIITLKQIPDTKDSTDQILVDFYLQCTSKRQRVMIEENLLTEDGHRKPSDLNTSRLTKLLTGRTRILQKIETDTGEKVEIVHDRLAKVIYNRRRRRDNNRFRNLLRVVVLLCLAIVFYIAIVSSWTTTVNSSLLSASIAENEDYGHENLKELNVNDDTVAVLDVNSFSLVEKIYIGPEVKAIDRVDINKDRIEFVISPSNKFYRWKEIKDQYGTVTGYLCRVDSPDKALYMQKDIDPYKEYRLPIGVGTLSYRYKTINHKATLPHYGEKKLVIHKDDIDWYQNDRYISSISFEGIKEIPSDAFRNCDSLMTVNFKGIEKIGNSAFEDCDNLIEVNFDDKIEIDGYAFSNCLNLKRIHLPRILSGPLNKLFSYCLNLNEVYLPDSLKNVGDIWTMFEFCPNLSTIKCSDKSHFKEDLRTGIWYYDSIPAIFNECLTYDLSMADSSFCIKNGIIFYKDNPFNFLSQFMKRCDDGNLCTHQTNPCFVLKTNRSSILNLPLIGRGNYQIFCLHKDKIKDVYTSVATPDSFKITFKDSSIDTKNITLHVPYGCYERYRASTVGSKFKRIVQEGKCKRIADTLTSWWEGIKWSFRKYDSLFYPSIALSLALLFSLFYYVRIRQMKNSGIVNRKDAVVAGIIGDIAALAGFIPVYWLVYIMLQNHIDLRLGMDNVTYMGLSMAAGTLGGVISACLCAYLFVFSGKGKIMKSWERMIKKRV